MRIDNNDVGNCSLVACTFGETSRACWASCRSWTFVAPNTDHAPCLIARAPRQISLVAGVCFACPIGEALHFFSDLDWHRFEIKFCLLGCANFIYTLSADVVASPFEYCPRNMAVECFAQYVGKQRQIVCRKLVLQSLGVRRDNNALARSDEWNKIPKCLASACSGLNNEMTILLNCDGYRYSHLVLSLALFDLRKSRRHLVKQSECVSLNLFVTHLCNSANAESNSFASRSGHERSVKNT